MRALKAEKPAAGEARGLLECSELGGRNSSNATLPLEKNQDTERALRPGEIPAARRAYALHCAYPWLPTIKIAARLAHDHGLYGGRWKPYRCRRLRRLIDSYAECVNAGVEPAPETIFSGDGDAA